MRRAGQSPGVVGCDAGSANGAVPLLSCGTQ